jgi:hypothetical protein
VETVVQIDREVHVPGVGWMRRIERRSPGGEVFGVEYRWANEVAAAKKGQ